jgi:hypothetical protein
MNEEAKIRFEGYINYYTQYSYLVSHNKLVLIISFFPMCSILMFFFLETAKILL